MRIKGREIETATIREWREAIGATLRDLADATGYDHSQIARWERGDRPITEEQHEALSTGLAKLTKDAMLLELRDQAREHCKP